MKKEKIDIILEPVSSFMKRESTSGTLLLAAAVLALVWVNSPWSETYQNLWHQDLTIGVAGRSLNKTLHFWINDGLMAMFFFVVGLELKREIIGGELSSPKKALLPFAAAIGGMAIPASIFYLINNSAPESNGWGIPMATDIAFVLGLLALIGKKVPLSLKIFLTALAIADDLGAVLVIAFLYTSDLSMISLATGFLFIILLSGANYLGVRNSVFYGLVGIGGVWLAFLMSGVHPTIAGVLSAMAIPARTKINEVGFTERLHGHIDEFRSIAPNDLTLLESDQMRVIEKIKKLTSSAETPLQRLENRLHPFVSFAVMPLFAFANAGVIIDQSVFNLVTHPVFVGIGAGLVVGKCIGIMAVCKLLTMMRWASLPGGVTLRQMWGVSFLAGVGFTMSLFIANLAYGSNSLLVEAKLGVLLGSFISGVIGYCILRFGTRN